MNEFAQLSVSLLPLTAAGIHLYLVSRSALGMARTLRQTSRSPDALVAGPASLSGTLHALGPPLRACDGTSCVYIELRYLAPSAPWAPPGMQVSDWSTPLPNPDEIRHAAAELRQNNARCRVDLRSVELQGRLPTHSTTLSYETFLQHYPELRTSLPAETTHVLVHETMLRDGVPVLLQGLATPDDEASLPDGSYRDQARAPWLLGPHPDAPLLAMPGHRVRLALRVALLSSLMLALTAALACIGLSSLYEAWLRHQISLK